MKKTIVILSPITIALIWISFTLYFGETVHSNHRNSQLDMTDLDWVNQPSKDLFKHIITQKNKV